MFSLHILLSTVHSSVLMSMEPLDFLPLTFLNTHAKLSSANLTNTVPMDIPISYNRSTIQFRTTLVLDHTKALKYLVLDRRGLTRSVYMYSCFELSNIILSFKNEV